MVKTLDVLVTAKFPPRAKMQMFVGRILGYLGMNKTMMRVMSPFPVDVSFGNSRAGRVWYDLERIGDPE